MRIFDLVFVETPDLGPLPGVFQEFLGDIPKGIALDHDMTVGGVFLETDFIGPERGAQS